MAEHPVLEEISCSVCQGVFLDPIALTCNHSFLKFCFEQYWIQKDSHGCPVCRTIPSRPPLNQAIKNLCKAFLQERSERTPTGSQELCSLLRVKLKLFCLFDKEPVCVICQTSRKHKNHELCAVEDAGQYFEEEITCDLKILQRRLETFNQVKLTHDQTPDHIKCQSQQIQRQIKLEFEKLHQFLREEESARIATLREKEEQKS
nr:PREDICTED: tripartite motif-containing protein 35-like [Lepisosteus oculatus]